MVKSRLLHMILVITLVFTLFVGFLAAPLTASAADSTPTPPALPPAIKLTCDVPSYSDNSGVTFNYMVTLTYSGNDTITTNLATINPPGWKPTITFSGKEINSIPIGPMNYGTPDSKTLSISLAPNQGTSPDPGEYKMVLKATSGQLNQTIDLTAVVKAKYQFSITTDTGNLATRATAGKDNHFLINLKNTGSVPLENLNLSVSKPESWKITFSPDKVTSLGAGQSLQEDVVITPPSGKTVAGDYIITISSSNSQVSSNMEVRVTVETSSIWGIVSIAIIILVIAGLAVLFLKLGRR
jgi:uncharacterized membrane protein